MIPMNVSKRAYKAKKRVLYIRIMVTGMVSVMVTGMEAS
jgi:hypothetical protein